MNVTAAERLKEWGTRLEQSLGILIVDKQSGALVLKTQGGHVLGVAPVPMQPALVFTGVIGVANASMHPDMLRSLLAANVSAGFSGLGVIGIEPSTQEILLKLSWTAPLSSWTDQTFASVLAAFSGHVDSLANAILTGELLRVLDVSVPALHGPLSGIAPLA